MKKVCLFLAIMLVCFSSTGFAEKQAINSQGIWSYCEEINKIADPSTENMLLMLNDDNYSQYTRNFSQQMKDAIPESKFKEMDAAIKDKFGNYISKEFISIELRENYIMVTYKGIFSKVTDPIMIRTVFTQENGKTRISGFWLNPLKLVGNIGKQ